MELCKGLIDMIIVRDDWHGLEEIAIEEDDETRIRVERGMESFEYLKASNLCLKRVNIRVYID